MSGEPSKRWGKDAIEGGLFLVGDTLVVIDHCSEEWLLKIKSTIEHNLKTRFGDESNDPKAPKMSCEFYGIDEYACPSCKHNVEFCVCVGVNWTRKSIEKHGVIIR